ncbi:MULTISPECIES: substrate-binding domain-containing protein [unclassified Oceanispirochaeta]|uniref:substrate-binding domain-containing protein n=1 Tax=unclassified Oceanispirochaeta TaxID=2635722 RepID=UPI000E08DC70|nr:MULTISPECIES: substrate-binding domain-containing protein [unclassified Oceanispirochaeta]MBF9018022.1 substrate-binding domain-containing protein [Oceanispirochaeta sp. M2]NPD74534.1 substrate-binding domain-containing protein [Oceanispirochaeta sp. M1]RDG29646.1 D-ribose ABC transporter substrate-binding protein [Oceanispirochaeta sp. M1]
MKKLFVFICIVAFIAPVLIFAGGQKDAEDDGEIVIGMTVPGLQFPFFVTMADEAKAKAAELGMTLLIHDSQNQSSTQMSGMENFMAQKVDGILISPMTTDSLVPAIEAAIAGGIPVATVDRQSNSDLVLIHVGADNIEGGRSAARFIIEKLGGKGKVIELEGTPGSSAAIDRKAGFDEIMSQSDVEVIVSQTAEFSRSEGQNVMEDLIIAYPDFDAVFGANDEMIIGAIEAMSAAGLDLSTIITVGFDATTDAFSYMNDGMLSATIDQFPGQQAGLALQVLYDNITSGKKPAKSTVYINPLPVTE